MGVQIGLDKHFRKRKRCANAKMNEKTCQVVEEAQVKCQFCLTRMFQMLLPGEEVCIHIKFCSSTLGQIHPNQVQWGIILGKVTLLDLNLEQFESWDLFFLSPIFSVCLFIR